VFLAETRDIEPLESMGSEHERPRALDDELADGRAEERAGHEPCGGGGRGAGGGVGGVDEQRDQGCDEQNVCRRDVEGGDDGRFGLFGWCEEGAGIGRERVCLPCRVPPLRRPSSREAVALLPRSRTAGARIGLGRCPWTPFWWSR
jgi:hypothetical protein